MENTNNKIRTPLPITNQKIWDMAEYITDKQKNAILMKTTVDKVDWEMLCDLWFDWLEEELFGNEDNN